MSFKSKIGGLFSLLFFLALIAIPIGIYFASQTPPGFPGLPGDAAQQANNFERKIIFIEQQWTEKQSTEVGVTAAEINSAYANSRGDDMRVAFTGNQGTLFLAQKILLITIYVQATGKIGVNQHRVTFTPTDLKLGTIPIPLTLADRLIQQKLHDPAMQEQLRLPAYISTVKVKDSQLMLSTSPKAH